MLVFGEETVIYNMLHNIISNDGFHSIACNAGDANRSIVTGQASRSFFVYLCYFGLFL